MERDKMPSEEQSFKIAPEGAHICKLDTNGFEVQTCYDTALSRIEWEGVTYITSTDMVVYVSVPLLNLYTGKVSELWLNKKQFENHDRQLRFEYEQPHPRIFQLPNIGLIRPPRSWGENDLQGFTGPGSSIGVIRDNAGHWWAGAAIRHGAQAYKTEKQELRFVTPWITYLGDDEDCLLHDTSLFGTSGQFEKVTLCSYAVAEVLTETGMWKYYTPKGKAQTNATLARKEALAAKPRHLICLKEAAAEAAIKANQKYADLKKTADTLEDLNSDLSKQINAARLAVSDLKDSFKVAEQDLNDLRSTSSVHIAELEQKLEEALNPPALDDEKFNLNRV